MNACIDGLIWVGNTYATVNNFRKEAQLRGCCRQLPFVPSWAEFGKTKIFLAHRDKHKLKRRGSVFGYFVLHRIEIITGGPVAKPMPEKPNRPLLWPLNGPEYLKRIKKWKDEGCSQLEIEQRTKEMLKRRYPIDIASGETTEEPWSSMIEYAMRLIDQQIEKFTKRLIGKLVEEWLSELNEKWLRRDNGGCFPPRYSTYAEGHRMCSTRKKSGSIYAVDALCAKVHDTFQQRLREYLSDESKKLGKTEQEILWRIQIENQDSWNEWAENKRDKAWDTQDLLNRYKGPFYYAVKEQFNAGKQPEYPIDPRLLNKAKYYGELIVFKKPYPILERAPQAAFRGICHIDGDKLIDQIAKHTGKKALVLKIYFCKEKESSKTYIKPLKKKKRKY